MNTKPKLVEKEFAIIYDGKYLIFAGIKPELGINMLALFGPDTRCDICGRKIGYGPYMVVAEKYGEKGHVVCGKCMNSPDFKPVVEKMRRRALGSRRQNNI
ncbi:hypothetical protein TTSV1_gp25 [Thermoproteus tenax spherical virus 1]|uniref:Uncharacterized protein n=1 Tax=Thermoproteus tenax spherical virus 1 TaxID=292639 RepID=Q647D7_9VIRU|nr:hypothetical protein TTSV1_gp25 [Thermoproteus tenax spherical virus 1]AAU25975.1 hypothetical protein [Thermoproteus tenax spherical virus 1]